MSTATIGHVTRERDEQIITGDRELVGQMRRIQFTIGDGAGDRADAVRWWAHPAPGEKPFGLVLYDIPSAVGMAPAPPGETQETVCCLSFPTPTPGSSGIRPCTAKTGR
ncbi:hypothetical protein ACFXMT_22660 [Streptomyces mirabilis]|uniref:hypothetical protein n=1 Tax=Streptomyces mirabilis TaxID=68239 RepID=UPI0036B306ED